MTISFVRAERQEELLQQVSELADRFSTRSEEIDLSGTFPVDHINELIKAGYTSLTLPKEYGGEEISLYDFVLLQERLAQGDGSTALSIGWHLGIVMDLAESRRWDEKTFAYVAKKIKNGALLNAAATEPQTGSPTRGGKPQTTARRDGAKWIIQGKKTFTTMAPVLDYFLVKASIEGEENIGEFLIPREAAGVQIDETWDTIAMQGTGSHDLILEHVPVDEDFLVYRLTPGKKEESKGWLLHIPACYIGIAQAARNVALQFASSYSPNSLDGPIKQLPNVQRMVGQIELELLQARHFLYSVADKWDRLADRASLAPELAAVKHVVTNTAINVVDQAMRIVGAQSLFRSNPLQRYYRDVRAGLHNPPMDDMTISLLARTAFESVEHLKTKE